jgi:hypothetical protein
MPVKKTHEIYLKELQEKEIRIVPLETYKGGHTKILHKCFCNKEWLIAPSKVLLGQNCGHDFVKTDKEYKQKLLDKGIKTEPLEEYIKGHTKIKHRCECGNVWKVSPTIVLSKNISCGCKRTGRSIKTYEGKKTILYFVKINEYYKIGLASFLKFDNVEDTILKQRYGKDIRNGVKVEIIKTKIFENGQEAYLKEQEILNEFSEYKYKGDDMRWFAGHSELFEIDISKLNKKD